MADRDNPNPDWPDPDTERAPGDVLGIERGGETTSLGDTEEDEDRHGAELEDPAADDQSSPRQNWSRSQRSALGFRRNQPRADS